MNCHKTPKSKAIPLEEMVGRTVESIRWSRCSAWAGDYPMVTLYFTDGTHHGFVLPLEED